MNTYCRPSQSAFHMDASSLAEELWAVDGCWGKGIALVAHMPVDGPRPTCRQYESELVDYKIKLKKGHEMGGSLFRGGVSEE